MTRWALVVFLAFGGCAAEATRFVAPILGGTSAVEPAGVQRDEAECRMYASARPSEIQYAAYVACLVSRGHRTYASLVGDNAATGVTVYAERTQAASDVFRDLTRCAADVRTRVDMPPVPAMFTGPAAELITTRAQIPFAKCMNAAGYATTLHATPDAVALAPAVIPPSSTSTPLAVAPSAPSTAPRPGTTAPLVTPPAPQTGAPSPTIAALPSPAPARVGRPVKLGLYVQPGTSPPVVNLVASDTPVGKAGVRPGDVVLTIDGASIRSQDDIATILAAKRPGDVLRLDVRRGAQYITVEVTLAEP